MSNESMVIASGAAIVRPWRHTDAEPLARHGNNRRIWLTVSDRFPHPYTLAHAESFIAEACGHSPPRQFAIEVDGEAAGGIGLRLGQDVERFSAEIGYWLAEMHWGRGIVTAAVAAVTAYGLDTLGLIRISALVFEGNAGSARVLEKTGFELEGVHRRGAVKDGRVLDQYRYARVTARPPRLDAT